MAHPLHLLFVCLIALQSAWGKTLLRQSDFDHGSYIIDSPGTYVLAEDVTFHPNSHIPLDGARPEMYLFPTEAQRAVGGKYSSDAFTLGFFAAIVIQSDNVVLDLNGHRLQQSPLHALMQRFFALVEIASAPFQPGKGPASFSTKESFKMAKGVVIKNGTLGRSSHHSIHGNNCEQVSLLNLVLTDFEVAGVSLNEANFVVVDNVDVRNSRQDVPVSGRFSQAIFALRAATVQIKFDTGLPSYAVVEAAVQELRASVTHVVEQVAAGKDLDDPLFRSLTRGLPDGSLLAGIVFHPKFNVGKFLTPEDHDYGTSHIALSSVRISNLSVAPVEVAALFWKGEGGDSVHDNVGAVFDVDTIRHPKSNVYVSNPLANLQLALAQYAIECRSTVDSSCLADKSTKTLLKRNTIDQSVIDWCRGELSFTDLVAWTQYEVVGNHDYMFHFNKGVIGVKLDGVLTASMTNVHVSRLENHATTTQRSIFFQETSGYVGFGTRAFAVSSSVNVTGKVHAEECFSEQGSDVLALDLRHNTTGTIIEIDAMQIPTEKDSLLGMLPINHPMFRRSGCPFGNPATVQEEQSTGANFEVAFYALLATQICSLLVIGLCTYMWFNPRTRNEKVSIVHEKQSAAQDTAAEQGITLT